MNEIKIEEIICIPITANNVNIGNLFVPTGNYEYIDGERW